MNHDLKNLDLYLQRVGISGLAGVSFGGQLINNLWHRSDCEVVGQCTNPMGPFPWSFLQDKMNSDCCAFNAFLLAGEIAPSSVAAAVRAAEQLQMAEERIAAWRQDRSSMVFSDCAIVDAIVEFQSEIDELSGAVAMRFSRLNSRFANQLEASYREFDKEVKRLTHDVYQDPIILDELFAEVQDQLGVERDDRLVITSCSSFDVLQPSDGNLSYLLHALTIAFALDSVTNRCISEMPLWGYNALRQLGGRAWLSKPYSNLQPSVEETARTLWVTEPDAPMYDFDNCVTAAQALCYESAFQDQK
jgi:hypothetical protein